MLHTVRRIRRLLPALALAALPAPAAADVQPRHQDAARAARLQAQQAPEPAILSTPRAQCRPGSKPEPDIQGRFPKEAVDSGAAAEGYWCNLTRVSKLGSTGGFRVFRYIDKAGRECAYYDTALLFPTNSFNLSADPTGVAVVDMSNPAKPVRTTTLVTPAMQSPHESVNLSVQRGILAAVTGNPTQNPGMVDVYDLTEDCRNPVLRSVLRPTGYWGHESGMAPDGMTYYPTAIGANSTSAVDISDPANPRTLHNANFNTHGMSVSDDGNRGYLATGDGLVIADLSEIQARKPNPQVREISRLSWSNITIPQVAIPVTIKGKPYVVEVDEYSQAEGGGRVAGHGPRVGAARIIDISDETRPRVISQIRLEVHQPDKRAGLENDYGARNPTQGYAAHYCNVPQRVEPGIFACSMIISGLRVFDIRDPYNPKEIAYHYGPPDTISETGGPVVDERSNWAMSQPAFAPERGEIWYSDGQAGFYVLRMDPKVWPFPQGGVAGCRDSPGLSRVGVGAVRGGLRLQFKRLARLPVRVEILQVSKGRRVLRERRVARFDNRRGTFTWRKRLAGGVYFARLTMLKGGSAYDVRRVVFERTRNGVRTLRDHHARAGCGLIRTFKLERPVFGGSSNAPLQASYRLSAPGTVTVTVSTGGKVIKRFGPIRAAANRTRRVSLPAKGLTHGEYTVRLQVTGADSQGVAALKAIRL